MADHIQIGDIAPRVQYAANGTQTQFTYPFPIFVAADLEVYLGATKQTSGFAVAGAGASAGGSVTFAAAPANGTVVTLRRNISIKRTSDFQESGEFRAKVINDELDYQTAALQQVADEVLRSLRLAATDAAVDLTLPAKAARAGKALGFDADGKPAASTKTLAQLETEADAAAASASAAAASATGAATSATNAATSATNAATSATAAAAAAASGLYANVISKSADYAVVEGDEGNLIRVDASGGAVTITLPDVTAFATDFRVGVVKVDSSGNAVTVGRSGTNTINGGTSQNISTQWQTVNFAGDTATGSYVAMDVSAGGIQAFKTIAVSGQPDVVADSAADTLTLAAGSGIALTTNAGTDTVTIAASGGGASAGWTLLQTVTASNSATVDLETTIDGTYEVYAVTFSGVYFSDATNFYARVKVGGSYQSTSYGYNVIYRTTSTANDSVSTEKSASGTGVLINGGANTGTGTNRRMSGHLFLHSPADAVGYKQIEGQSGYITDGDIAGMSLFAGAYMGGTGAVTGFRLVNNTGTITAGVFKLYGLKKTV